MNKESLKNLILALLVVTSVALTFNMWIQKKLWPEGYNFFSNITKYFNRADYTQRYLLSKENVSYPTKIIVTNIEKRSIYTHTMDEFEEITETIMPVLKKGIASESFEVASLSQWESAIKGASVYMSYPVAYEFSLMNAILGLEAPKQQTITAVKEIIICSDYNGEKAYIFIKDDANSQIYTASISASINLIDFVAEYSRNEVATLPFSFELNFDMEEDAVEQSVIIEPTVTIPLTSSGSNILYSITDEVFFDDANTKKSILDCFYYNTATANRYRDNNNTSVYVDNNGTLKFHENNILEYKALDNTKGIKLATDGTNTYDCFISGIEFVNNILTTALPDATFDINLSTYSSDTKNNSVVLAFDYFVDGKQIQTYHGTSSIKMEIVNGNLVSYSQIYNKYIISDETVTCPDAIMALDTLLSDGNNKNGTVVDLYIGYKQENERFMPNWFARTKDGKTYNIGGEAVQ